VVNQKLSNYFKGKEVKKYRTVGALILLLLIVIMVAVTLTRPKRSVAAYCNVYRQEKVQLGNAGGNTYEFSTTVFPNASSNNAGDFVPAFSKMAAVAPAQIEPQVVAMKETFQKLQSDPTQALSLALNGLPAESAVTQWTQQHCGNGN
jgi:hypothetical protein